MAKAPTMIMLKNKKGFTLVELLIAVSLLGLIVTSIVGIFFANVKSEKKTNNLSEIKQSGDYALSVMRRMVRNASEVTCNIDVGFDSIEIVNPDGNTTTFKCTPGTSGTIASKSAKLIPDGFGLTCDFSCDLSNQPPTVEIDFTLNNNEIDPLVSAEQNFSAFVTLRNY